MDMINPVPYEVLFTDEAVLCPGAVIAGNPIHNAVSHGSAWKKIHSREALSADHACMPVMSISHKLTC
ncbi:hypothetical protein DAMNIGENAA_04850 [Desulforhabdus amnigena]|uniref:Uncharacterized protein n=1 Tax=Desulforhabdus amnigena TaxID=40218 RepID=A0A9W6CZB6_9BACT|nr:hypothetical protein DAMNIGENAA_04850 [Desulforhabdus amnigena]